MNTEIFKSNGELRKRPPKKYICKSCGFKSSGYKSVNLGFIGIGVCKECGGSIKDNPDYVEWEKRTSGQWDMEERIIEYLSFKGESSKEEIFDFFGETDRDTYESINSVFRRSFSDLVYWGKLKVRFDGNTYYYTLNF